jgi:hypothetical protein
MLDSMMYPYCDSGTMTSTWQSMSCGGSSSSSSSTGGMGSSSSSTGGTSSSSSSSTGGGGAGSNSPYNLTVTKTSQLICNEGCYTTYNYGMSWSAPSGATPIYYRLEASADSGTTWGNVNVFSAGWALVPTTTTAATTYNFANSNASLRLRVRAEYGYCTEGCYVSSVSDWIVSP